MNTRLCYNSTDRRYEVRTNQRVLSVHPNRQDALLAQLGAEAPEVVELARTLIAAHPVLTDRALRAVTLASEGAVQATDKPLRYRVRSQQKRKGKLALVYTVDLAQSSCTCPDWVQGAPTVNGRTVCKHVLAALFIRKLSTAPCEAVEVTP